MNIKKMFLLPLIIGGIAFQLTGCAYSYRTSFMGSDSSNSTKVEKVQFVEEYNTLNDETKEQIVTSYSHTEGIYGRVYLKNVPDDKTNIKFIWKDKDSGKEVAEAEMTITPELAKKPIKSSASGSGYVPKGIYIMDTYLKDSNTLLNETEITVTN